MLASSNHHIYNLQSTIIRGAVNEGTAGGVSVPADWGDAVPRNGNLGRRGGDVALNRKKQTGKKMTLLPSDYKDVLDDLKAHIITARHQATLSVNRELIKLYWTIGEAIVTHQKKKAWGQAVIEHLAMDIQNEFPGITGFSPRNIWRMRGFYLAWTSNVKKLPQAVAELDGKNLPQVVAQIPWGHNALVIDGLNVARESTERHRRTPTISVVNDNGRSVCSVDTPYLKSTIYNLQLSGGL